METRPAIFLLRCVVSIVAVLGISLFSGCSKEEPKKTPERAANPYSADSVFDELRTKLKENPNDAESLYHLADLYERNAQYTEAIETYRKVVLLKPDMGYAYFKMGTAYDRLERPEEALTEFRKAARYLPAYPVLYNNMGVAYGKLGRFQDEIASLKKAVKLRPAYSSARFNLGITYLRIHDKKAALREYEALSAFDEGAAEALKKEIDHAD